MIKKISGLLCLVLISSMISCSSDSSSDQPANASMTATVDGQSWASINGGAIANLNSVTVDGEEVLMLQIVGTRMDFSIVSMQFPVTNLAEGTYTFSNSDAMMTYSTAGGSSLYTTAEPSGTFTITITDLDVAAGTLSGTFSGTLVNTMDSTTINVTNGTINTVSIMSSAMYSNGTMSLSKNGGAAFTMDDSDSDGKYIMIMENSASNTLSLNGYNANLTADFGLYNLTFPKDVTPGTYNLMTETDFSAGIGNAEGEAEYNLTSGTVTVTSHNGTNVAGTFSFTASNGTQTVTITNGTFNVTHN